jgi:hypothetical protein
MRQLMAKARAIREKHRRSGVGFADASMGETMDRQPTSSLQVKSPARREEDDLLLYPGAPPYYLRHHLEAFGLLGDPTFGADVQQQSLDNMAPSPGMPMPAQGNFSDEDMSQWLAQERTMQIDTNFYLARWNMGIQNIGDVPMSTASFDQIPPMEGPQGWL